MKSGTCLEGRDDDAFAAPWYGSLAGHIPAGQSVTGIAGE